MGFCPSFEGWFFDNPALTPTTLPEKAKKNTHLKKVYICS